PHERARVDVGDRPSPYRQAEGLGLAPAERRERHVLRALELPDRVGDGLAVAREQEAPHRWASTAAAAALSRATVSARPRMLTTSKIDGLAVLPVNAMRVSWARSTSLS